MVQENRRGQSPYGRYRAGSYQQTKSSQHSQNLMAKLMSGQSLTTQELMQLQGSVKVSLSRLIQRLFVT